MKNQQRIYELTTNEKDGFTKWYVRGIIDDKHAEKVALKGFGKKYYSKSLINYYDNYPSEYGTDWSRLPTIKQFIKKANKRYKHK